MFAIAARYKTEPEDPLPLNEGDMWNAGDEYLEDAKNLLSKFSILFLKKSMFNVFDRFDLCSFPSDYMSSSLVAQLSRNWYRRHGAGMVVCRHGRQNGIYSC